MGAELLIADDDPVVRHLLGAILRGAGYQVATTESGTETISLLQARAESGTLPSLVLLDLQLVDMAGTEVLAKAREIAREPRLPVVLLSANKKEEILRDHPAASDADGFLEKPFPPDTVLSLIEELLAR